MSADQHRWGEKGSTIEAVVVFEDWLGPVSALIQSVDNKHYAVIYLIAWKAPELKRRIFALRAIQKRAAEVYLRNIRSDYCDLDRKKNEAEALFAAADPVSLLIRTSDNMIEGASATDANPPQKPWRDISPDDYLKWKEQLAD
ncbi:MAG: hypothetical protein JJ957_04520 [Pseudomonadales bacterium]|nr:hypothetical protein [Pseudomonadales bacterium]MBO6595082.1 hypothetical protein [Pseudomonadales bacterium]MBO6821359.1 hypothetical protein [Pseudomonadales bacterium]